MTPSSVSRSELPVPVDVLVLFRAWTVLSGFFYALWSLLVVLLQRDFFDAPLERMVIFALFVGSAAASLHPRFPKHHIDGILFGLAVVYFLHFMTLVHRSGPHEYYLFATLVLHGIMSVGFRRTTWFGLYFAFAMVVHVAYGVAMGFDQALLVCFVGFNATSLGAFIGLLALRERSDRKINELLNNILPSTVVDRIKEHRGQYTEHSEAVTVLFADIVGFTTLTRSMEPKVLIEHLNDLFSQFDRATDEYGVEKIKTIGDCYMAVCGAPTADPTHRMRMLEFGMRLLELQAEFCARTGLDMELRIGVHTGPIVAGVIGSKKTVYDLWGDTVNLASRMESHGKAGAIQVTTTTAEGISGLTFSVAHTVDVKGIGPVQAKWLLTDGSAGLGMRLALGLRRPRARGLGQDVAGIVEAVGPGVSEWSVVGEVFGETTMGAT
ncbi:MAG: hypothetical protein GY898_30555 [Proteobacteria bacterium]|nr:hypothetical protein [Pseudomonadota bacterium]